MASALPGAATHGAAWIRRTLHTATAILLSISALVAARRFFGAVEGEVPLSRTAALALAAIGWNAATRLVWRTQRGVAHAAGELALVLGGSAAVVLLALACGATAADPTARLVWAGAVTADLIAAVAFWRLRAAARDQRDPPDACEQRLVRWRDAAGSRHVAGELRADFRPDQRHAVVHAAFCPPLAAAPAVNAETASGPLASVKILHAAPHGVRLEVRLDRPAARVCHVLVEFAAHEPPAAA